MLTALAYERISLLSSDSDAAAADADDDWTAVAVSGAQTPMRRGHWQSSTRRQQ